MSFTESTLQRERPKRPGEFTFTWSIHNYSYCTNKEGEYLRSPEFVVDFLGNAKWELWLFPRGRECPGFISCYLYDRNGVSTCNFTLSIRKSDGQFKEADENIYNPYIGLYGCPNFVGLEELKGPDGYLVNDTLTLRCRMWKTDADIPTSVKCDVHSRIKVSKLDYTWILSGFTTSVNSSESEFKHSFDISHFFKDMPALKIHVFNEGNFGESALHFGIEMGAREQKSYILVCVIHLLDANGRVAHSACCQHLFQPSTPSEVFNFPIISSDKFNLYKNLYVPRGQLTLQCEFGFASDSELETFVYRTTNDLEFQPVMINLDTDRQELWTKNIKKCYTDGRFSDFTIRTPGREFPVSRTVLSAQSEVFGSMFESDMKERQSGVVDIEDLDDDTVSKMLMYVYTNTLGDIDCSTAQKLYYAADKYRITALQEKCSNCLKLFLDDSNVCEVLVLADTHGDQDLKSCVRDFVHARAQQVMNSESWKKLTETNPHLTSETMQWMILNKFLM